jgi:drug/metabolite transporter (DMT)-like permease
MRPEWVLVLVTMVWGGTFLMVKMALTWSGPFFFVGMRFTLAALILALFTWRHLRGWRRLDFMAGGVIGVMIGLGYGLQTLGLGSIASSKSAFITALYVPLVPLMQWAVWGRAPRPMVWAGIAMATIGLFLIAGPEAGGIGFSFGEVVTILSVFAIAGEVVLISVFAGRVAALRVTVMQLAVAGLVSFAVVPVVGEELPPDLVPVVGFALVLGVASALIQWAMNWAQRAVSPTRATLIYAGEPVWAGIIGRIAGERLGAMAILGAALIIGGMVAGEWPVRRGGTPRRDKGEAS